MNNLTPLPYRPSFIKTICALIGTLMMLGVMVFQNTAWGIVSLDVTRVIIDQKTKEANVRVLNEGDTPVLIQAWIDTGDAHTLPEYIDVPFIITAPLFRLEAKAAQHLRIIFTGAANTLPTLGESVFWLNIQEVPPTAATEMDENNIQIAFRTRVKLFYRPQQIPFDANHLHTQLTFEIIGSNERFALKIYNPTPIHITILKITISSNKKETIATLEPKDGMVPPDDSLTIPLEETGHAPTQGKFINYIYLDDFGVPTEQQKQLINSK